MKLKFKNQEFQTEAVNSVADLFEYISGLETTVEKLTNDIKTRDNIIDSQIVQIAGLHTDIAVLREKLSKFSDK